MAAVHRCELCGAVDAVVVSRWARRMRPVVNVVCRRCGLVRQDPMPGPEELKRYYETKYRITAKHFRGSPTPRSRDIKRDRQRAEARLAAIAPVLRPGARILDVGSGSGIFLALVKERGYLPAGIEPDATYSSGIQQEFDLPIHTGSWETAEFPAGFFDVVVSDHVFEHLARPFAALRKIHEWTADGGHLYLSVPNICDADASPFNRFQVQHLHGYSPKTLEMIGRKAGFAPTTFLERDKTFILFQRRAEPDEGWFVYPEHGSEMVSFFRTNSPLRFLLRPNAYQRFFRHIKRGLLER